MLFREALGEILREERLSQEKTLRTLSSDSLIALGYLSEVERGHKELSSEVLHNIATRGLGLDTHEIIMRTAIRMAGLEIPDTAESLFTIRNEMWTKQYADLRS